MPRKQCYWTRKLELELVDFIRRRECIWKSLGNTNHHIQQKYKAYAEFASKLGRGFTARSVRDRWVNIRSTYNHILRRIEKSKETAQSETDVYVPCWPLWKPLQFLRSGDGETIDQRLEAYSSPSASYETSVKKELTASDILELNCKTVEEKININSNVFEEIQIRQRGERTNRPRKRFKLEFKSRKRRKCKRLINDLVKAMEPLSKQLLSVNPEKSRNYWFFGKHVTEQLNRMRRQDADCASRDILKVLNECDEEDLT